MDRQGFFTYYALETPQWATEPRLFGPGEFGYDILTKEWRHGAAPPVAWAQMQRCMAPLSDVGMQMQAMATAGAMGGMLPPPMPCAHNHAIGDVNGLQGALDGKQPAGSYETAGAAASAYTAAVNAAAADATTKANAAKDRATHTGTQSADTITDGSTNKAYSTAEKTKLAGIAPSATANATDAQLRDRASHTGTQSADTVTDGSTNKAFSAAEKTKLAGIATGATANASDAQLNAPYVTILQASGSHTAGKVAGTYAIPNGDPLAVSGTGTLYPIATINIVGADFPAIGALTAKLRIRAQLYTNDVAPTGNFTIGLYPISRPGTSGGAGLCIYTLGTVVLGSDGAKFTAPAADLLGGAVGQDFALPADGHYCLGMVTTGTVAANAHVHIVAQLQMHHA